MCSLGLLKTDTLRVRPPSKEHNPVSLRLRRGHKQLSRRNHLLLHREACYCQGWLWQRNSLVTQVQSPAVRTAASANPPMLFLLVSASVTGLRLLFLSLRLSLGNPVICSGRKTVMPERAKYSPALFMNILFVWVCHHWYLIPLHRGDCVPPHSMTLIWRTLFDTVAFWGLATVYTRVPVGGERGGVFQYDFAVLTQPQWSWPLLSTCIFLLIFHSVQSET